MKQKVKEKQESLHPAHAAAAAFNEVEELDCINLLRSDRRVENAFPTGSLALDLITGGGYKPGLMATLDGLEGSGKSTLALLHALSAQILKIPCILYDPEAGSDPVYMRSIGLDINFKLTVGTGKDKKNVPGFFYTQPDTGEAVYRHILRVLSRLPITDDGKPQILLLIDSLAGMGSEEVDEVGDGGRIADEARMHSYFLKRVVPRLRRRGAVLVATNQLRQAIGSYGTPLKATGGKALNYWPGYALRISSKRVEADKIGVQTLPVIWRTTKNKAFPPFRTTENRLILGRGLDRAYDAFYFLKSLGFLEIRGGKQKILLPGYEDKVLSWREFRYQTENPSFRAMCQEMLKDGKTWRRYFEQSEETTYFYDEQTDYAAGENEDDLKVKVEEEAAEYEETLKARRKQGKRPRNKSKAQDNADLDLDEATAEAED